LFNRKYLKKKLGVKVSLGSFWGPRAEPLWGVLGLCYPEAKVIEVNADEWSDSDCCIFRI